MTFLQDIRYAARSLARRPILTATVAITLLIGIGLNAAVFAAIEGMWFRPRVEKDPGSFVQMLSSYPNGSPIHGQPWTSSLAAFAAMRAQSRTVTNFAAWQVVQARIEDEPRRELSLLVTCEFFSLYGLDHAAQGRLFNADECGGPATRVALISEELWRNRFFSSPVIGTTVRLNHQAYRIVGVAPAQFAGRLRGPGVWIPFTAAVDFFDGRDVFQEPSTPWLFIEGRMRRGSLKADVEAEIMRIAAGVTGSPRILVTNGSNAQNPANRGMMLGILPLVMAVMSLVLLMACSNVTILLLARAAARRREIAIRRALGADRARILRMLITEGLLLASLAGSAAAVLAHWLPVAFRAILWRAPYYPVNPDWIVFTYLAGITLVAGCAAGFGPAVESFRSDLSPALKKHPAFIRPRSRWQMRDLQVAVLVAISVVLVAGAALFVRAQLGLLSAGATEAAARTIVVALRPGTPDPALLARVRAIPAVESVVVTNRRLSVVVNRDADEVSREIGVLLNEPPQTQQSEFRELAARFRTLVTMVAVLGAIALLLAILGVYGVVAFAVSQRSQELAIRVALGARRVDVVRAVLGSGFRPIIVGLAGGVVLALGGAAALDVAFRASPVAIHAWDPMVYIIVCALLATASAVAMFRPAWRAGSVDPALALREE